jgi:hypothetical protein
MHICWVGGIDRSEELFERTARDAGHSLEMHTGRVGGRGAARLAGSIERADLVVIVVEVNSHGGALQAKELARRRGRPSVIVRKPSLSALQRLLRAGDAEAAAHAAH